MGVSESRVFSHFSDVMARLGPFEPSPLLAVGVSGGGDSLALCLLAAAWAEARGGQVIALTVDHGLRPESADEAVQVGRWLALRGIEHRVLSVGASPPCGGVQAWARLHRYALFERWCRKAGCLHLLLAHHRQDQAETVLLRLARGSGVDGLAAMSWAVPKPWGRILRPLLDVEPEMLRMFLRDQGQSWIEDPSNRNNRYARVRMRQLLPCLASEGADTSRLAGTASRMGRVREAVERQVDILLAKAVWVHPLGFALLSPAFFLDAPSEIALRALSWVVRGIGGQEYGARLKCLESALWRLGRPMTIGGCRLRPLQEGRFLEVTREVRTLPENELRADETILWDGRFRIGLPAGEKNVRIAPLESEQWRAIRENGGRESGEKKLSQAVLSSLPGVWRDGIFIGVPALGIWYKSPPRLIGPVFAPCHPLGSVGLRLVKSLLFEKRRWDGLPEFVANV